MTSPLVLSRAPRNNDELHALEAKRARQREWARKLRAKDPQRQIEIQKRYRHRLRDQALAAYGESCRCCGEDARLFLAIDHVENDGAAHRREHKIKSGTDMLEWLKRNDYPEGFQTLCHNCNVGKKLNGGVCPHVSRAD